MANVSTFSVVISGKLKDGFDPAKIQEALAALLKVPPEKAAALMRREWVVKKDLDQQTAVKYKSKLESIGLVIGLKEHSPPPPTGGGFSLSLEPTEEELQAKEKPASPTSGIPTAISCPKCGTEQPTGTEQCRSCGVYLNKVLRKPTQTEEVQPSETEDEETPVTYLDENLTGKSIGAGAAAALLGAIVWNVIGRVFDYELGIVAWGIGGAIGFAVAVTGSRGEKAAMACAALALFAILGGKYMLYSGFAENFSSMVSENMEDVRVVYDEQVKAANSFAEVSDDESLRQFMIDFEYTDASSPDAIADDEIDYFKKDAQPALIKFNTEKPDFEQWVNTTITSTVGNVSTMDLLKGSFGVLDIVFLFLGVGTAYRLGRGMEMK